MRNTNEHYGKMAIILHWLMAVMIISLVFIGFMIDDFEKPFKFTMIGLHKATGTLILILSLFRWYWTISNQSPKPLDSLTKAEIGISHATKWLLMVLLILMPISGALMSMFAGYGIDMYGLFEITPFFDKDKSMGDIFHEVHEIGGYLIAGVIILHVLAALKHHFIKKDNTLNRMLGKK